MRRRPLPPVREESPSKCWRDLSENDCVMYVLVALVGVMSNVNSLYGEFVHDDIPAIVTNADVTGGNPVTSVFVNDFWGTPMSHHSSHKSYRPLTTLSFRLNHWLCGARAVGWHAANVALHAACCTLVARVALVARLRRPAAALAAILFAVHPVHTEAVAGIVGRADVLACLFYLSSILLYHGCGRGHRVYASVAAALLSTLAKETGLTALVVNLAFDAYRSWAPPHSWSWIGPGGRWRCGAARSLRVAAALTALAGARLAMLHGALPAFSAMDNPPAFHPSFSVRLLTFCYLAALNWWLALCPWALSHDWQLGSVPLVHTVWDPRNLLTCAAAATLLALTYRCIMDLEVQRHTPAVVGLMLLVIPYLPASNLLVTVGFVVAERVLYIPSVGSVLLTAYGIQLLWQRFESRRLLVFAVTILLVSGASRTYLRNRDWRTRETLLRADLATMPHNAKLHYNFANFLKDTDQTEKAIKHYKEALRLWPSYASAHNNLGTLVVASGRAEYHFQQALRYNKDHVNAHYNLGKLYRKKERVAEAQTMLERCIQLEPRFVQAYLELLHLQPLEDKRPLLDKLLELEPGNHEHRLIYGNWYKDRGLVPLALQQYVRALSMSLHSRVSAALRAVGLTLRTQGQQARVLQVIVRWQVSRADAPPAWRRARAVRAWRLRSELAGRAALYQRPPPPHGHMPKSTCLHHSKLEVSHSDKLQANMKERDGISRTVPNSPKLVSVIEKTRCKSDKMKKSVSISGLYKPTHNKSESGVKQKSCPLHKKENIQDNEYSSFVSDHFNIKTY